MTIPEPSETIPLPDISDTEPAPELNDAPEVYADDAELAVTRTDRYCPFCGHSVVDQALFCPHCQKDLHEAETLRPNLDTLNPVDWILVTLLAPLGFVGGFVSLVMGNRKGLTMIGISTLSVFLFWLLVVIMGWIV